MRKFLQLLMLVLMVAYGAQSWGEVITLKAGDNQVVDKRKYPWRDHEYSGPDFKNGANPATPSGSQSYVKFQIFGQAWLYTEYSEFNQAYYWKIYKTNYLTITSTRPMRHISVSFSSNGGHGAAYISTSNGTWEKLDGHSVSGQYSDGAWTPGSGAGDPYSVNLTADNSHEVDILWIKVFFDDASDQTGKSITLTASKEFKEGTNPKITLSQSGYSDVFWTDNGNDPAVVSSPNTGAFKDKSFTKSCRVRGVGVIKVKAKDFDSDIDDEDNTEFNKFGATVDQTYTMYYPVSTESGSHKEGSSTKYYATFCDNNYMKVPEGCTAYTYKLREDGVMKYLTASKLYGEGAVIPPNTPVIVQSDSAITKEYPVKFKNPQNNIAEDIPDDNRTPYFKGNGSNGSVTVSGDIYFLMRYNTNELRFMRYSSNVCPAHACYLDLSGSSAKSFVFQFPGEDDETTGISVVTTSNQTYDENAPMYNTAGQRVGTSYKGIVIQNGRKFLKR